MTPENFCYWLQGYIELRHAENCVPRPHGANEPPAIHFNESQLEEIKRHLGLVMKRQKLIENPPMFMPKDTDVEKPRNLDELMYLAQRVTRPGTAPGETLTC